MNNSISDYLNNIAAYIHLEYGNEDFNDLTIDEKYAIKNMLLDHFKLRNSINNSANDVVDYIRSSRQWMKENIK